MPGAVDEDVQLAERAHRCGDHRLHLFGLRHVAGKASARLRQVAAIVSAVACASSR